MIDYKHTPEDLKIMQAWPLERKAQVTQTRIVEWYLRWGGQVFVSFSGGKDSSVLLDLARRCFPDIEAVYVDTGLEFPEVRAFALSKENVTVGQPRRVQRGDGPVPLPGDSRRHCRAPIYISMRGGPL